MKTLTQNDLFRLFRYEPETGRFVRLSNRGPSKQGDIAGGIDGNGYVLIGLHGTKYKAHRMAWLYMYGEWPSVEIDHVNGNKTDNRISNLREATREQNCQNRRIHKNNVSGNKGIHWCANALKWVARIQVGKKRKHLGYHRNLEDAKAAIMAERGLLHGDFANHGEGAVL